MEVSEKTTNSVLVTGAANAVGHAVAHRLASAGYRVTGAVTTAEQAVRLRLDGVLPAYPDLSRAGEIKSVLTAAKADVIVHAATQDANHVPQLKADWAAVQKLLEQGTPALISAAQAAGVKLIIFLSYAFAGDAAHGGHGGHDEEAEEPAIVEAARAAEQAILHGPVPAVVLRAGYTYGPQSVGTITLRDSIKHNRPLLIGGERASANWVHVEDLASAVLQAIDRRPEGQIIDVVDDQPASPAAFAGYLAESMNITAPGRVPPLMSRMLFKPEQSGLIERSVHADNANARQVLGWKPQFANYRAGIDQTLLVLRAEEPVR